MRTTKRRKHQPTSRSASQTITKAVTNIRMVDVNQSKLVALDDLAQIYLSLCQQYVTLFCTEEMPDRLRVAIQQAAGVAQSWRTNQEQAYQDHLEELAEFETQRVEDTLAKRQKSQIGMSGMLLRWGRPAFSPTAMLRCSSRLTIRHLTTG